MTTIKKIFFSAGLIFLAVLVFGAIPQIAMPTALAGESLLVVSKQHERVQGQSVSEAEDKSKQIQRLVDRKNENENWARAKNGVLKSGFNLGNPSVTVIVPGGPGTGYGYTINITGSIFEFIVNSSSNPVKYSIDLSHSNILTYYEGMGGTHVYKKGENGYESSIKTIADILTAAIRITSDQTTAQSLKTAYNALVRDSKIINGWEYFTVEVTASKKSGAFQISKNAHYWDTIDVTQTATNSYLSLNTKDFSISYLTSSGQLVVVKPGTTEWNQAFNQLSKFVESAFSATKDAAQRTELKKIRSDLATVKSLVMNNTRAQQGGIK